MLLIDEIVNICHKVYEHGFVAAYDGNISALTENNTVLITRSAICKGEAVPSGILEIDLDGNLISGSGKITTELKLHLYIYKKRKDIRAVVHCHPVYATAFAMQEDGLPENLLPEVLLSLGNVPLCKYATPSTDELPQSLAPYIEYAKAFLLQNHGAVTTGANVKDAYYKMEKLEHAAKTIFTAKMLGKMHALPADKIEELLKISGGTYGINIDKRNIFTK